MFAAALEPWCSKRILKETHVIPLWPGNRPWHRWKKSPGSVISRMRRDSRLSHHLQMSVARRVWQFMFCPSQAQGAKSPGITPQHGKGNSAQACAHILSSPEGYSKKWIRNVLLRQNVAWKPQVAPMLGLVSCGLAALPEEEQTMFRGCLCDSSTGSKASDICGHRWNPSSKQVRNSRNILCHGHTNRAIQATCLRLPQHFSRVSFPSGGRQCNPGYHL